MLQIAKYLFWSGHVPEEHLVAQAIERHAERREPVGGGAIDRSHTEAFGEAMRRGEAVALAAQLVVIREVGPTLPRAPGGDVVRKQTGKPQAVVPEVHTQQEAAFSSVVEPREVLHHVDQIVIGLVVGPTPHAGSSVVIAELQQEGRKVVGEQPVVDAGGPERVTG